jgi:hypothetical protein
MDTMVVTDANLRGDILKPSYIQFSALLQEP